MTMASFVLWYAVVVLSQIRFCLGPTTPGTDPPGTDPPGTTTVGPTLADPKGTDSRGSTTTVSANTCSSTGVAITVGTTSEGPISSVNYPSDYDTSLTCRWTITAFQTDHVVQVTVTAFSVESSTYCNLDYLAFYEDADDSSLINSYCGTSSPGVVSSADSTLHIKFVSDGSITSTGFSFTYIALDGTYPACISGFTTLTATTAALTFSSTGYPSSYSNNVDEYWVIANTDTANYELSLKVTTINIERSSGCIYDKITVHNGPCRSDTKISSHCGTTSKRWFTQIDNTLVHFHTDSSATYTGFEIEYQMISSPTTVPTTTTSTTTLGAPVTAIVGLIDEIVNTQTYDFANIPARDLSQAIQATLNIYLVAINDLDESDQKLTTTVLLEIGWTDNFLSWLPAKKSNIIKLLIPQGDIWKPDVALLNGFSEITQMGSGFMYVVLNYNGSVVWRPYQVLHSTCRINMRHFPFDIQVCELKLGAWATSDSQIEITFGGNGFQRHEFFQQNSEWTLKDSSKTLSTVNSKTVVTITLTLERNPVFVSYYMLAPVVMLSVLNIFTFVLPPDSGEKSGVAITIFLAFVVYVVIVSDQLPLNSDTTPYFALYVLSLTILSAIILATSIVQIKVHFFEKKYHKLGCFATRLASFAQNHLLKLICSEAKSEENKSNGKKKLDPANEELRQRYDGRDRYGQFRMMPAKTEYVGKKRKKDNDVNDNEDIGEDENDDNGPSWKNVTASLDFICLILFAVATIILTGVFLGLADSVT